MKHVRSSRFTAHAKPRQRGVVLIYTLIALVIMLIAAAALVRSFNSTLFTSGNIAFKRDLQNQSERATNVVLTAFRPTGTLASSVARSADIPTSNYSSLRLPTNAQGIPTDLLLKNTAFAAKWTAADLASTDGSVQIRYVIDRLCAATGDEAAFGSADCIVAEDKTAAGTSSSNRKGPDRKLGTSGTPVSLRAIVYRLSVRATGPRNTQSFFQSTFTVPTPPS